MTETPPVTDMMVAYAEDAIDMAKTNFGVTLDYSEASIETVEVCLAKLHDALPKGFFGKLFRRGPTDDEIRTVAMMFGGYIGEVFRQHHGGEWLLAQAPQQQGPVVTLQVAGGSQIWPTAKVYKRLLHGPENDVWAYYCIITSKT